MQKAYLRELRHSKQCELVFPLKFIDPKSKNIILDEEIHAACQCTANVQCFLEHITKKIKKLSEDKGYKDVNVTVSLRKNGADINPEVECKSILLQNQQKNVIFTICDQSFKVIVNAPLIQNITLPNILYVNYVLQPIRFKAINTEKRKCEYIWYKSLDQILWTEVGYTYKYKPKKEDIDHYLKFQCLPKNSNVEGPIYEVITKTTVQVMCGIPECPFQKRHEYTSIKLEDDEFRVVCYNTLADLYSENNAYFPYCSPEALSIDYRKQLILKELLGYNADIICLQEVDQFIYLNYFKSKLKTYKGVFHKKGNRIPEGLACFFNAERFKLLLTKQLVFGEEVRENPIFSRIWKLIKQGNALKECIIKQPTSLQITVLKLKQSNKIVVVANTHLYYHSDANDIRLLQTAIALEYIKDIVNTYKHLNRNSTVSIIFCGDFNSVPTSAAYEFCSNGNITYTFEQDTRYPLRDIVLTHPFKFISAYGTPPYTNYTGDFKACLDYIFFDQTTLSLTELVPIPNETILSERTALPNELFPSDHLALIASFKFT